MKFRDAQFSEFERAPIQMRHRVVGRGQLHSRDAQLGRRDLYAVELAREFHQCTIAATANGIDNRNDVAINGATGFATAARKRIEEPAKFFRRRIEDAERHRDDKTITIVRWTTRARDIEILRTN